MPAAAQALCARLHAALPAAIGPLHRRTTAPTSVLTAAWGNPPARLRCGVGRPAGLSPDSAQVAVVDGVAWFQDLGSRDVTWTVVDRRVAVELVVPMAYAEQGNLLVDLAGPISRTLPRA